MQENYGLYYKTYWDKEFEKRKEIKYYERLYHDFKKKLVVKGKKSLLDIGGGNGHFMYYLGIRNVTIMDISDSGLKFSRKLGYKTIKTDIHKRFPIKEDSYDVVYCFEVLEHLNHPSKTLTEVNNVLKDGGVLFIGQPNNPADGVHHVRRIYIKNLIDDLNKTGFNVEWVEHVPAFNTWQRDVKNITRAKCLSSKFINLIAYILTFMPKSFRKFLAYKIPNRFSLLYIVKARKI
ncbi:MAG: class I SAM-dependent methyltransferase [Nanoarchaeota archaeon]|nr:class I SAM-dependent methyltransferase [Nanoarchaeota archaeon]MBU1269606.1 class I SAM-dependent methyltransferase [Nanoarchaeota archaeon]MBU1604969.1 class I SAM-dependent methyltransferase [Nanoarchaeota archaeon]MBU2442829.1 class I SAM-dependent methyltransferase [Nanoarchaeota archaeon]